MPKRQEDLTTGKSVIASLYFPVAKFSCRPPHLHLINRYQADVMVVNVDPVQLL